MTTILVTLPDLGYPIDRNVLKAALGSSVRRALRDDSIEVGVDVLAVPVTDLDERPDAR